jgi:hypothetical protein
MPSSHCHCHVTNVTADMCCGGRNKIHVMRAAVCNAYTLSFCQPLGVSNLTQQYMGKLRVSQFPIFLFLFVGHFQNAFSQKAAGPAATSFGENPRTHSEVQGPLGDDVTFQESLKS